MKFSDELISDVARTLQIAILSGTDIVDHLRTFEMESSDGNLKLTKESKERIEREIESMLESVKGRREDK
mgnify:FL=1|tara:strand:+ start:875 stop:1084 length:210 start_codon:yes stop_codon:yes gene_type:complete